MKLLNSLLLTFILIAPLSLYSQKVISTKSTPKTFKMTPEFERPSMPPNLFIDLEFSDANGNGILEADEKSVIKLNITNKGKGLAQGVRIKLTSTTPQIGLTLGDEISIQRIKPDETKSIEIPINADKYIKTGECKILINVTEYFGYDIDPAYLIVNTYEYQKAKLAFAGLEIYDTGEGTSTIVADGQLQAGEKVKIKIMVQNVGNNVASGVKYKLISKDINIFLENNEGELGNFKIGEVKEFWISVSPNKRVITKDLLPLYLYLTDDLATSSLSSSISNFNLPISLNQRPPVANVLTIKADVDKLRNQIARFEFNSDKYSAKISVKNIDNIQVSKTKRPNAVAIVIGVESYDNLPPARYAARDAEIMTRYFKDVLGIENVITHVNKDVSGFFFDQIFDSNIGKLARLVERGKTEVFIYYSGHGIPQKDGKDVYLFPSDGNVAKLETQGYSLNKLFDNLNKLNAKNVTVILDACFSGSSRVSKLYNAENISNTKGFKRVRFDKQPWDTNPNFTLLSSSDYEQTSLGFDDSQTGLFTYYVAVGLQGDADLNGDKKITLKELYQYLTDKVVETSKRIRGEQTPQLFGNADMVLVEL